MDLEELRYFDVERIYMDLNRVQKQVLVNVVINLRVRNIVSYYPELS